jgi:hypothetical protein
MTPNFGNFLSKTISFILVILREFWWLIIPLTLFVYLKKLYKTYKGLVKKADDDPMVFLEIKFSLDSFKQPVTSMKNFFENLKNIKIKDGKKIVFEILCFKNQLRYICMVPKSLKDLVEVAFYSQYTDIKILEVMDYLSALPPNIPNNNFDIWGEEYKLKKESIFKINVIRNDIVSDKDSKVIDPITILAEAADKTDYQGITIVQIVLSQLNDPQKASYALESENVINKLLGKPVVEKKTLQKETLGLMKIMLNQMLNPAKEDKKEEKKEVAPEDKAKAGELKTKNDLGVFACNFRVAYIAPKACIQKFVSPSISMFVKQFTSSQNSFEGIADKGIEYKVEGLIPKLLSNASKPQIELSMKKDFFQRAINRKFEKKIMVLNSEELATIFHFPFQRISVQSVDFIKNKEVAPPSNLPIILE